MKTRIISERIVDKLYGWLFISMIILYVALMGLMMVGILEPELFESIRKVIEI